MAALALSAEAAWLLQDRRAAESIASMLGPFADRAIAIGSTIYLGSAQRYVGLLAWTAGAHDRAKSTWNFERPSQPAHGQRIQLTFPRRQTIDLAVYPFVAHLVIR